MKNFKDTKSVVMFGGAKDLVIRLSKHNDQEINPTRAEAKQILRGLVRYFLTHFKS